MLSLYSFQGILLGISILLVHSVVLQIPYLFKNIAFVVATGLASYGLTNSLLSSGIVVLICLISIITEENSAKDMLKKFTLFVLALCGNWIDPSMQELILLVLLLGVYATFQNKNANSLIGLWCLTLIVYIYTSISSSAGEPVALVLSSLLVVSSFGIFWFDLRLGNIESLLGLLLICFSSKYFIDKTSAELVLGQALTFSSFSILCFLGTLTFLVLKGFKAANSIKSFLLILGLTVLLPISSEAQLFNRLETNYIFLLVAMGSLLLLPLSKSEKKSDIITKTLIGLILIASQLILYQGENIGQVQVLILSLSLSAQLFFLMKKPLALTSESVNRQVTVKTGERLPQYLYIMLVFGAAASLWYILSYVRQIQG